MGSYYYLGAQLPGLVYGQPAPMSSAAFKSLARDLMSVKDSSLLDECTLDPDPADSQSQEQKAGSAYVREAQRTDSKLLNFFRGWERTLRLNLARSRIQKFKREGAIIPDAPDYPAEAAGAAKTALAMESPLEAEIFMDKARWNAIESIQGVDYFSENAMYAYLLKLLLLERRAAFKTEEGYTEYKALYAAILGEPK